MTLSSKLTPYLKDPLVQNVDRRILDQLDRPDLNNAIRAEDQIIRGVREFSISRIEGVPTRLHPGHFGSSINIARALTFIDISHYCRYTPDIMDGVYRVTPTAKRPVFNKNMAEKIIPDLISDGIVQFDSSHKEVGAVMPYPIASKYYVHKHLMKNTYLYQQQINHFEIINGVQDFPQLKSELEVNSSSSINFDRDYSALETIDVIRSSAVGGRDYTFSKSYITGEKSIDTWQTVLDTSDTLRQSFRDILVLTGESGGFVTLSEIARAIGTEDRMANRLIRHVDNLGLAQRTHDLRLETALARPTSGTLLGMNYTELNNAPAILSLIRSEPAAIDVLNRLHTEKSLDEEELISKYGLDAVSKIINTLEPIGIVSKEALRDAKLEITPNRGIEYYLDDVLTIAASSRKVTDPDYDVGDRLVKMLERVDDSQIRKTIGQAKLDFFDIEVGEMRK